MKIQKKLFFLSAMTAMFAFQSCTRTGNDVWEDTKSAGRHLGRGIKTLTGAPADSRQIRSRDDFESIEDNSDYDTASFQDCEYVQQSDFVPLQDSYNDVGMADMVSQQPRETPGEPGSSIPGIEAFRDPSTIPQMAGIFRNIYFEYDSSLVKGQENLQTIHAISDYLRRNPNVYAFIEGHTDERGPQAYNLALGSRRSNSVRNMLISEGVNPDHLFTVSYGKERPLILEKHEEGWSKNRRCEFKVYVR